MSEQTCLTPSCLTDRQVKEAVLATKMNVIVMLCSIAVGLLSYSVFWQAPSFKADVQRLDSTDNEIKSEMERMGVRLTALEGK